MLGGEIKGDSIRDNTRSRVVEGKGEDNGGCAGEGAVQHIDEPGKGHWG